MSANAESEAQNAEVGEVGGRFCQAGGGGLSSHSISGE